MADQEKKPVTIDTVEYSSSTPFIANITTGRVVKVYDGDTITVATNVVNDNTSDIFYRFSVNLTLFLNKKIWIRFITRLLH